LRASGRSSVTVATPFSWVTVSISTYPLPLPKRGGE
jgi:hypothetical protein